jgi:hypothetical protein
MRLAKTAWRSGYYGLACAVAIAWDTSFSPVDVRTLAARHRAQANNGRLMFDRRDEGRTKTGKAAIGTISTRTQRLVKNYLATLGAELHPDAILLRNLSGNPYREGKSADDFRAVRQAVFPGDKRCLMDMRRSESHSRGAEGFGLAAKMANSIDHSNALNRTHAPVDEVPAVSACG